MPSSTAASMRWAAGRDAGSRRRPLRNSTYQSQKSFQVKSRSRRAASANWKPSRSSVVAFAVFEIKARIQRSSTGKLARSTGPGS